MLAQVTSRELTEWELFYELEAEIREQAENDAARDKPKRPPTRGGLA